MPEKIAHPPTRELSVYAFWLLWLLWFVALGWLYLPAPLALETVEADAEIFFAVNKSYVFLPQDCIQVHWTVENIQAVYVNGQGQIGSGILPHCLDEFTPPTLEVQLTNGETTRYELPVTVLSHSPLFWLFIGLVLLLCAYLIRAYWPRIKQAPRVRTVALAALWVIGVILALQHIPPTQETIATGNWREAASGIKSLLSLGAVLTLLLLITMQALTHKPNAQVSMRNVYGWLVGITLALGLMVTALLSVNPRGMYISSAYTPHQLLLRGAKFEAYINQEAAPELVLLGSSRMFTLSPRYIAETLGYSAFNMAVEGGRTEDILIASRFIQDQTHTPEVFLIEVQEGLPREPNDIASRAPLSWLPYMRRDTQSLTIQKRFEALFDLDHLSEALYIARYNPLYERTEQEWAVFLPDGEAERSLISNGELGGQIAVNIGTIPPLQCEGVNLISQAEITELVEITQAENQALVFYLSPWHPDYYNAHMRDNPAYQRCYQAFSAYMQDLAQTNAHVFFADYSQLAQINGLQDENGYYDSDHLTPENSRRLIDHLAPTLTAAFAHVRGEG